MICSRLHTQDQGRGGSGILRVRDHHVQNGGALGGKRAHGLPACRLDLGIQFFPEEVSRDADAQPGDPAPDLFRRLRDRGQHGEQQPGIGRRARQRAEMVERPRERDDAGCGDRSVGRLQPGDAAERCRNANGPAGIGTQCRGAKSRGHRRGRPPAGPSRSSRSVPGVPH